MSKLSAYLGCGNLIVLSFSVVQFPLWLQNNYNYESRCTMCNFLLVVHFSLIRWDSLWWSIAKVNFQLCRLICFRPISWLLIHVKFSVVLSYQGWNLEIVKSVKLHSCLCWLFGSISSSTIICLLSVTGLLSFLFS
jgi:hypothetical protein